MQRPEANPVSIQGQGGLSGCEYMEIETQILFALTKYNLHVIESSIFLMFVACIVSFWFHC